MPLVSIIIPMYNAELYLSDTLESVKLQTYKKFEIIIVDNCSTDHSYLIADEFCKRTDNAILFKTDSNSGGPAHPRNVGIKNAKGKYIAFLDSDDLWDKNKLYCQINRMIKSNYNFTCTSRILIDEKSNPIVSIVDKIFPGKFGKYSAKQLVGRNSIVTSSVIVSRELLNDAFFSEIKVLTCVEDIHLWLCLLNKPNCSFFHLREKLVCYRFFNNSLSRNESNLFILSKSMLATMFFIVESKRYDLFVFSLFSHFIRSLIRLIIK